MQFTLAEEPIESTYRILIGAAARWRSTVLLVVRDRLGLSKPGAELMESLEPFLLARHESKSWPGTELLDSTATVLTYRLDPVVVTLLETAANGLYAWQQPELPEDLCFLRETGDPWLVSIAHEADGYLVLEENEIEELRDDLRDVVRGI